MAQRALIPPNRANEMCSPDRPGRASGAAPACYCCDRPLAALRWASIECGGGSGRKGDGHRTRSSPGARGPSGRPVCCLLCLSDRQPPSRRRTHIAVRCAHVVRTSERRPADGAQPRRRSAAAAVQPGPRCRSGLQPQSVPHRACNAALPAPRARRCCNIGCTPAAAVAGGGSGGPAGSRSACRTVH